jgi:transcriptional regulator with XRE-family HTH domain
MPSTLCCMSVNTSGTPKARALGAALREAREAAGLTVRQLAAQIDRDFSLITRWEKAERRIKPVDVAQILTALGIVGARFEEILALANDTDAPLWIPVSLAEQRQHLNALLRFERDAIEIVDVAPLLVTGLVQTEAYIRGIMTTAGVPEDEIEARVRVRLGRQRVVETARLTALLGEAALHQEVGGRAVLVGQLRHLLEVAEHPNVDLRVVPFTAGWVPSLDGGWTVIESAEAPTMIHLENRQSGWFLHEDRDVEVYRSAVASILGVAMSPQESVGLIAGKIQQLETR